MSRTPPNYQCFFDRLVEDGFPFAERIKKNFYKDGSASTYQRKKKAKYPSLGALQPLLDMHKDFVDTFKPYKSKYHIKRDFLQPWYAVGNLLRGIAHIVGVSLFFVLETLFLICTFLLPNRIAAFDESNVGLKDVLPELKRAYIPLFIWLVDGLCSLVRGTTQVVATPLTWFIKIPLRFLITFVKDTPDILDNPGIKRLVGEGCVASNTFNQKNICYELKRKYKKAKKRGQRTEIDEKEETELWTKIQSSSRDQDSYKAYFSLFDKNSHVVLTDNNSGNNPTHQEYSIS